MGDTVVKNCSYSSSAPTPTPTPPQARVLLPDSCKSETQNKIAEFCLVYFQKTGKLEKMVKPQFHHSHNPAATQIAYHGRRVHIMDVTFIPPHFSKTIAEKKNKNCLSELKICRVSA